MKKYYIEKWDDETELGCFETEEQRQKWFDENCYYTDDGGFLKATNERVAFYDA